MAQAFPSPPASPAASGDTYESTSSPSISSNILPLPPVSTDNRKQEVAKRTGMVQYYWPRYFERNPVDPAKFFDRVMTDYANHETDIVGTWIEDMNSLYKLHKACLAYGAKHGTPQKSIEAQQFQIKNKSYALEPGVQDTRCRHSQLRAARGLFFQSQSSVSAPIYAVASAPMHQVAQAPVSIAIPEMISGSSTTTADVSVEARTALPSSNSPSQPEMSNQGTSNQNRGSSGGRKRGLDWESLFDSLIKDEILIEHSAEDMRMLTKSLVNSPWKDALRSLRAHLQPCEHYSIQSGGQKHFFEAIFMLWTEELRPYLQNAIRPENIIQHPYLKKAVVEAARKDKGKCQPLNNFGEGWDFSRFVYIVERLITKEQVPRDPLPNLKYVVTELKRLRQLRNEISHPDYSTTGKVGFSDDELEVFISFAGTYLPRINALKKGSPEYITIQEKLQELQRCLYYGESDVVLVEHENGVTERTNGE